MTRVTLLCVIAMLPYSSPQTTRVAFGAFGAMPDPEGDAGLDEREEQQIETAAANMASQFEAQLKQHITEQVKASKAGGSKLAQSRVAGPSMHLHAAAGNNQYEKVAKLLASGADVNAAHPAALSALHVACEGGYRDVVDLLLAHNASVTAVGPDDETPLHLAAQKGRFSVTELLLREGADTEALTVGMGATPLYLASQMGHTRVVALLLNANATVDAKASDGSTPLHVAAREGHESVVEMLLEHGAHVDEHDNDDARPLHWAMASQHADVESMLLEAGAAPATEDDAEKIEKKRSLVQVEVTSSSRAGAFVQVP